tara:strand:- start:49 stop:894 length:846 start_codon:yes stop_codon:yes gene_type:complete
MARSFPDGSKATRAFPDPPEAAAPASNWTVVYEADFTTAFDSTQTLSDTNTRSISGKTWTAKIPSGKVDSVEIISGTGLKFSYGTGNDSSDLQKDNYSCPRLQASLPSLVDGLAIDDTIAVQVLLSSSTLNDNWQCYGLHISDGGTANKWFENSTAFIDSINTGSPNLCTEVQAGTAGAAHVSLGSNPAPGMRELVWYAGSCGFVASHAQASEFVDPLTSLGEISGVLSETTNAAPSSTPTLNVTISNATLCLHSFYNNYTGGRSSWNCTFSKLRVLKRNK